MLLHNLQEFVKKLFCGGLSIIGKIFASISLAWMIFIGYLIWWNEIKSLKSVKSFQWDEWIWFGLDPAITPFLIYIIWKKRV